jgi:hypothetical protein
LGQPGAESEGDDTVVAELDLPEAPVAVETRVVVDDGAQDSPAPEAAEAPEPRDLVVRVVGICLNGVSTRKSTEVVEKLCGLEIASA